MEMGIIVGVVKGTKPNLSTGEVIVDDGKSRRRLVIDEDLDPASASVAHNLNMMPSRPQRHKRKRSSE
jgi:hypothetical protein